MKEGTRLHRFFIPKEWFEADKVNFFEEPAHQIINILRLKPGDRIIVLDNSGWEYLVNIEFLTKETVYGTIVKKIPGENEPSLKITLYQSLLKADKFEFILQKGTELGVHFFVPVISARCVVNKVSKTKIERWQKIITEAAEQSERSVIPELNAAISFTQACEIVNTPSIMAWEEEKSRSFSEVMHSPPFKTTQKINLFVGPEGGFPESEAVHAREHGIITVRVGKRILRAETAALVVISALMFDYGELD